MNQRPDLAADLAELPPFEPLVDALRGTVLDPTTPQYRRADGSAHPHQPGLFTNGAAPRDLSALAGLGATLQLTDGTELVDLCSMTENTILGLNDPWVKIRQLAYLLSERPHYVTVRMGNDLYYRVANRITKHFASVRTNDDFVVNMRECTGSGAVELALHAAWQAARGMPERHKLASFTGAFHGSNLGGILVSDHQPERGSGRVLIDRADNVEYFAIPRSGEDGSLDAASQETLATLERDGDQYFAVIVEPVSWRNAVHVLPTEFLRRLGEICTSKSICLIFDEVQNGFGYTGTISYGELVGVFPNISVFGKGLTSGHGTLAIMVADRAYGAIESPFGFKSNSANMLSLVAVDAVLDRLLGLDPAEAEALPGWLPAELAESLRTGMLATVYATATGMVDEMLTELCRRFPAIAGPPKGVGLFRGIALSDPGGHPSAALAAEVARVCLTEGVHVRQADTAIFIKPCLTITQSEIDVALEALSRTLATVGDAPARSS